MMGMMGMVVVVGVVIIIILAEHEVLDGDAVGVGELVLERAHVVGREAYAEALDVRAQQLLEQRVRHHVRLQLRRRPELIDNMKEFVPAARPRSAMDMATKIRVVTV